MKILVKKEICGLRKQYTDPLEVLNVYSINYSYHKSWNKNKNKNENKVSLNTFIFKLQIYVDMELWICH